MSAEHRRPFAALVLVVAFACLIMFNGLRTQVAEVFISAGAPRQLVTVIAPDMVLGQSLSDAPKVQAPPEAPSDVPATSDTSPDQSAQSGPVSLAVSTAQVSTSKAAVKHRNRANHSGSAAPVKSPVTTPVKTPVKTPATPSAPAPKATPPAIAKPDKPVSPGKLGGGRLGLVPSEKDRDQDRGTRRGGDKDRTWKSSGPGRSDDRGRDRGQHHGWSGPSRSESQKPRQESSDSTDRDHGRDGADLGSRGDQGRSRHGR